MFLFSFSMWMISFSYFLCYFFFFFFVSDTEPIITHKRSSCLLQQNRNLGIDRPSFSLLLEVGWKEEFFYFPYIYFTIQIPTILLSDS